MVALTPGVSLYSCVQAGAAPVTWLEVTASLGGISEDRFNLVAAC